MDKEIEFQGLGLNAMLVGVTASLAYHLISHAHVANGQATPHNWSVWYLSWKQERIRTGNLSNSV